MNQELTPKQQAVELIKQAHHILLVTGREPNNDQLASVVALELILRRAGKQVSAIMTGELPKARQILDVDRISRDITGIRDFIIRLDTSKVEVDKLRYEQNESNLEVIISPFSGNFSSTDATFDYGAYKFDLVIVLGVSQIARIDSILEQNPTIFDGLHLINIDCHRSNDSYGSVNFVDPQASSICEMLVGVIESVAQGMIDYHVATALLTGIMSSTQGFTGVNTTAKSLTIAAQMMSGGAKQQDIVGALFGRGPQNDHSNTQRSDQKPAFSAPKPLESKPVGAKEEPKLEHQLEENKTETIADKLKKQGLELSGEGVKDTRTGEIVKEASSDDSTTTNEAKKESDQAPKSDKTDTDSPSDQKPAEGEQSVKKFKNKQ